MSSNTQEQMERVVRSLFEEADLNKDGFLTIDEIRPGYVEKGYPEAFIKMIFQGLDTSKNDKVSVEEYVKAMTRLSSDKHRAAKIVQLCKIEDKDGNGIISRDELKAVMEKVDGKDLTDEEVDAYYKSVNPGKDGLISYKELADAIILEQNRSEAEVKQTAE